MRINPLNQGIQQIKHININDYHLAVMFGAFCMRMNHCKNCCKKIKSILYTC